MALTISDLGSIGEFLSSVAVMASLIYLSFQIRHNTRSLTSAAIQDINTDSQRLLLALTDLPLAKIMLKVQTNQQLSEQEAFIAGNWLAAAMRGWENQFYQYRHGLLEKEIYEARMNALLDKVVRTTFGRKWWQESGRKIYSRRFLLVVDGFMAAENICPSGKVNEGDAEQRLLLPSPPARDADQDQ